MPGPSCVRRAPPWPRRRFPSRPRQFYSPPFWRRRVDLVPGGNRSGRQSIPGNKALQTVPIEPFAPNTPEKAIFLWQSVGLFKVYFNRDNFNRDNFNRDNFNKDNFNKDNHATPRTAYRTAAA